MKDNLQILLLVVIAGLLISDRVSRHLPKKRRHTVILDSCGLIDGRILELTQSGFIAKDIVIPQFVLAELQLLADGRDAHKRERARYGLEVVQMLQSSSITVTIDPTAFESIQHVDDKLVALATKLHAWLYTTDFNLNKIAAIKGVQVLNVNELAQNLRPIGLPGELVQVKIIQKGSGPNQGVGYLEDGTMVVVDNAVRSIGKTVSAKISRSHQTVAGKMVFAIKTKG